MRIPRHRGRGPLVVQLSSPLWVCIPARKNNAQRHTLIGTARKLEAKEQPNDEDKIRPSDDALTPRSHSRCTTLPSPLPSCGGARGYALACDTPPTWRPARGGVISRCRILPRLTPLPINVVDNSATSCPCSVQTESSPSSDRHRIPGPPTDVRAALERVPSRIWTRPG